MSKYKQAYVCLKAVTNAGWRLKNNKQLIVPVQVKNVSGQLPK